ncbi:MAG TPA: YbaB/EbfC family nucleoid-associated protein [bacterium]|nr:YbaB/EbfC family nucleoid-associated protein [bacterium]HOL46752.1 YbaB/EbfC family nucleoid-associated protein [bacterium]HPQ18188.1 YbaB/EbfC family nucleoid-associated protein [bacterium]
MSKQKNEFMKMFNKLQSDMLGNLTKDLENKEVTGTAAGDMVKITLSGDYKIKSLKIAKDLVDPNDVEFLEDSIIAAYNDASKKLQEILSEMPSQLLNKFKF